MQREQLVPVFHLEGWRLDGANSRVRMEVADG